MVVSDNRLLLSPKGKPGKSLELPEKNIIKWKMQLWKGYLIATIRHPGNEKW
jgi:hypothetical protein